MYLVIAKDAMIAKLLAQLLELVPGGEPVESPRARETAIDALERLRPRLGLVDCDPDCGVPEEFFARAATLRIRVLLFSPTLDGHEVARRAAQLDLPWFATPITRARFKEAVRHALA